MDPQQSQIKKTKNIYIHPQVIFHILTFGVKNLGIHFVIFEKKKRKLYKD